MSIRQHTMTLFGGLISITLLLTGGLALLFPVTFRIDHNWLSPLAIALGTGIYLGTLGLSFRALHRISSRQSQWVAVGLWLLLLTIQGWVAVSWVAAPRADLYFVHQQALDLLHGSTSWPAYFQTYANNVSFTILLSGLLRLGQGIISNSGVWLNLLQFIWLDCGLLVVWLALRKRNPARANLWIGMLITTVPLYAYALNAYTDVYVLPFMLFAIVAFTQLKRSLRGPAIFGWALLLGLSLTGAYLFKANYIVLTIAALLLLWLIPLAHPRHWLVRLGTTVLIVGLLFAGIAGNHNLQQANGYHPNADQALPAMSWVAMSWNPAHYGEYNRQDATTVIHQPTVAAKKETATGLLHDHLQQLGPIGILGHLFRKARLFLATGTFDAFQINSAFDRAPHWYRQHRSTADWLLANWCQVSYLALILVNLGWGIQQLRRRHLSSAYLLGGIFMMGLVAFHVVFWETEERYALPLLLLLLAGAASGYRQPRNLLRWSRNRLTWLPLAMAGAFTLTLGLVAWQNSALTTHQWVQPLNAVSQNEGRYYQNHKLAIKPHHALSQPITATIAFNKIIIDRGEQITGHLRLTNAQGKVVWRSQGTKTLLAQSIPDQPAGRYTLTLTNQGTHNLRVVTAPATFPLLPKSLLGHPNQYLRLTVQQYRVGPILTQNKFWLLFATIWLGGLLIIDRFYWYRRQI
ncbi:glycosyltransferase family 39 protein [Levilactobacillus fujinensis]|uniref:Glycosyltransferase family 39 protein n=1 Tax=Levilactobacillus fujinensis TaxID=2486024 RepID=A0ABW1TI80_9LACO|nr:glycosyltransferase family 39 protein [Levilactobacillus fujinensis]